MFNSLFHYETAKIIDDASNLQKIFTIKREKLEDIIEHTSENITQFISFVSDIKKEMYEMKHVMNTKFELEIYKEHNIVPK